MLELSKKNRWFDDDVEKFDPERFPACVYSNIRSIKKVSFHDSLIHMDNSKVTLEERRIILDLFFKASKIEEIYSKTVHPIHPFSDYEIFPMLF